MQVQLKGTCRLNNTCRLSLSEEIFESYSRTWLSISGTASLLSRFNWYHKYPLIKTPKTLIEITHKPVEKTASEVETEAYRATSSRVSTPSKNRQVPSERTN